MLHDLTLFLAQKPAALSVHLASGLLAFGFAAYLFGWAKGTRQHRIVGWLFVGTIMVTASSGFFIYEIYNGIGPFHLLSIFTLVTVFGGLRAIRRASPSERAAQAGGSVAAHVNRMSWCAAALVIAAAIEAMRLLPFAGSDASVMELHGNNLIYIGAAGFSLVFAVIITAYAKAVHWRNRESAGAAQFESN